MYKYFEPSNLDWDEKSSTLSELKRLIDKYFLDKKYLHDSLIDPKENNIKLHSSTLNSESIYACLESMLEGKITLGESNLLYEKNLANNFRTSNAISVNSGSSANLLAIFGLIESEILRKGDKVIVPSLSWSTTVFPLIQAGLIPVFCDQSTEDYNINLDQVEEQAKREDVKALMLIHTYGLTADMDRVMEICKRHNITLIEDTCESMGAEWAGKYAGSFGEVSTFSTYYSHHICTLEGGIVLTNNAQLDQTYRAMRSHGWARSMPRNSSLFHEYKNHDPSFLFPYTGFNLRISEPQARIGIEQLKLLPSILQNRIKAGNEYLNRIKRLPELNSYSINNKAKCVFFGMPLLLPENYDYVRTFKFRENLRLKGIETRPFLCGDFTKQPALKKVKYEKPYKCNFADSLHQRAIALPCHQDITLDNVEKVMAAIESSL